MFITAPENLTALIRLIETLSFHTTQNAVDVRLYTSYVTTTGANSYGVLRHVFIECLVQNQIFDVVICYVRVS